MKVQIHTLFQYLLETTEAEPEAIVGFSLSRSPRLGDFLEDLDPKLSLDWNQRSFRGVPELRAHILRETGLQQLCGLDDVLVTAGAAEANYLAIMQLLEPDDEIVVETPGWPQAAVLAKSVGSRIREVERRDADGWSFPMNQLADSVTDRTRIIFVSNPNNPTGQLLTADELGDIVKIARRVGAWLIVDEVYAGLEWEGTRAPSVAGLYERGITTGSVSKALGLQGLRTGWLICQDKDLVMDAVILRENSSEIMNVMGETIAEIAMRPERILPAMNRATRRKACVNTWIRSIPFQSAQSPSFRWVPSAAPGLIRPRPGLRQRYDGRVPIAKKLPGAAPTAPFPSSSRHAYAPAPPYSDWGVGGGEEVNLDKGLART